MPTIPEVDYGQLYDTLPGAIMLIATDDPKFTIISENKAHVAVSLSQGKAAGRPFLEAFPDTSPKFKQTGTSDVVESLRRVVKTKKSDIMNDLRYDLIGPDGQKLRRYWRATHFPIFDDSGELAYILQSTMNVTEEVLARRKLDEAQRQLDEALAIGLIGTWLWDLRDDYVVADKNLLRLFGVPEEEAADGLPLKVFTDSIHPDDRARITAEIEKVVQAGSSFEEEYRTISRNGEVRWVIARGRIESDEDGKPLRFPGVIVDVTERKTAEQNLRFLSDVSTVLSSSLDYSKTLQSLTELAVPALADWCAIDMLEGETIRQVAIAHKDPEKVSWAHEFRAARPPKLDEPAGVPAVLRTGEPEFYPAIDEALLEAAAVNEEDKKLVRSLQLSSIIIVPLKLDALPIGALTLVSTEKKRLFTEDDLRLAEEVANRASLAIANADLYQRAQAELDMRSELEEKLRLSNEKLEQRVRERTHELVGLNKELERSNQELQDFAYVASHDLQEPLRKIQAFGNLLEQEYGQALGDGHDYLRRMQGAAARMSSLISDLLSFSRVTTKIQPFVPVALTVIASDVVNDLEARVAETGGTVSIGKLPIIEADPVQMRQLFQNLIGNALKFHREGVAPKVMVKAGRAQCDRHPCIKLTVSDNGVGFNMKYLDRIFAVFQRLHGREQYEGTGIGLAVCRKIVERHGGTITADSTVGEGTTFIITLPIKAQAETKDTKKEAEQ